MLTPTLTHDYAPFISGAAVLLRADAGVLSLGDADRVDFLQRMTTNHIAALRPGSSCVTVLTSSTAKVVEVFTVLARADDLLLLPAPGAAPALERRLRGQIFFMDKVKVTNLSANHARVRVMGPHAGAAVRGLGLECTGLADGSWQECGGVLAVVQEGFDVPGIELVLPAAQRDELLAKLVSAGAALLTGEAAYQARRIELGRPAPGAELTDEYSPLEAGLAWACAENKGCYTGQEIIARQITYDKVTRALVGLRSAALLAPGTAVTVEGKQVGLVTSSAFSPALQAPAALAIVKKPYHAPGAGVEVNGMPVEVAALPLVV